MSEYEYDPFEYAQALAEGEDLGHGDLSRASSEDSDGGMSRRDLLIRGGVGAPSLGALGALAGPAAARQSSSSEVDANGKFTGTLRVLPLGGEFPIPDIP